MQFSRTLCLCLFAPLLASVAQINAQVMKAESRVRLTKSPDSPAASDFSIEAPGGHAPSTAARNSTTNIRIAHGDWQRRNKKNRPAAATTIVGALVGGLLGLVSGGAIGFNIEAAGCSDVDEYGEPTYCGLGGFILGASAGSANVMPVGAHLGNGRRGNLPRTLLATIALTGGAIAATMATQEPSFLLAIPVGQLLTSVILERKTGR